MKLNVPSGPERRRETWEERESLTVETRISSVMNIMAKNQL